MSQKSSPFAVLLCRFQDTVNQPMPFSGIFYRNLFTNAGTGLGNMVDFFRDYSHGNVDIGGSEVFGPMTLAHNRAEYAGSGANPAGRSALLRWARDAALAAGVDLAPFKSIVVCMNVPTDLFGGGDGVVTPAGNIANDHSPAMLAQEMLHTYGLQHSQQEGGPPYSDKWDAMSTASQFSTPGGPFSSIGPGSNAANMDFLNWLDQDRVWTGSGQYDQEVELRPHHRRDLEGLLVARVGPFYVEYRAKAGWDASIPRHAVLVHRLDGDHSVLMKSLGNSFDLPPGDAFEKALSDATYRVSVTGIDPTTLTARLRLSRKVPDPVVVPDVYHAGRLDARADIQAVGLVAAFKGYPQNDAWVVSQSPQAGTSVPRGSTVTCSMQKEPTEQPLKEP